MAPLTQETAEVVALKALAWIIQSEETLPIFMGATGVSSDDLRTRTGDPEFLVSVLDFLMMDDRWITEFCEANRYPFERPAEARQSLPGGEQVHWT